MINEDKTKQIARNIAYNLGNKVCGDIKTYGYEDVYNAALQAIEWKDKQLPEWLTAFAIHLQKRGAFRDDLCMDFEHEAQSFIEMQNHTKQ